MRMSLCRDWRERPSPVDRCGSLWHDGGQVGARGLHSRNEERQALLRGKGNSSSKVLAGDGSTASRETSAGHRPTLMCGGPLHFRRGPRKIRTACLFRSEAESSTSGLTNACTGVAGPGGFKWRHSWRPSGDARLLGGKIEPAKRNHQHAISSRLLRGPCFDGISSNAVCGRCPETL